MPCFDAACRRMLALALWAAMVPFAAAQVPPTSEPTQDEGLAESARDTVRSATVWLARGVDSWFGDVPFEDGGKVTEGRLSLSLLQREQEDPKFSLRFNARVRLPNVERRAYVFIGRDNQREVITDKPGAFSRPEQLLPERTDERSVFAGIGVALRDSLDFRLGLRGGLKPYTQVRWRRPWQLDDVSRFEFRETVFWSLDDHLGSTTALSYERALSSHLAARWIAAGTVTQVNRTLEWSSLVGLHRSFGAQRMLSLEALINGRLDSGVGASDYGLQTRWEQPVYKDWLIGEVIVGHFWPREDADVERRKAWALGGQLKMKF